MDELFSRILIGGFLLAIVVSGVLTSWGARRQASDPTRREQALRQLRAQLWQAGVLDGHVTQADEAELLTHFTQEQRGLQAVAPAALIGAAIGGSVASVYLAFGASLYWAFEPIMCATLAGVLVSASVLGAHSMRNTIATDVLIDETAHTVPRWHPTVAVALGCAAVAISVVVPLVLLMSPSSLEPSLSHGQDAGLVRGMPLLLWIGPTLVALVLVLSEIVLHVSEKRAAGRRVSSNQELQVRAVRYRRRNLRAAIVFFEALLIPLVASITLSNLPLQLRLLSSNDALSFGSIALVGIGALVGISTFMTSSGAIQNEAQR